VTGASAVSADVSRKTLRGVHGAYGAGPVRGRLSRQAHLAALGQRLPAGLPLRGGADLHAHGRAFREGRGVLGARMARGRAPLQTLIGHALGGHSALRPISRA